MPKTLSATLQDTINRISAKETVVVLLEITHSGLTQPIRVAHYSDDIVSNGNTFIGLSFQFSMPDDLEQGLPQASIIIDNVGKPPGENSIAEWLEVSDGGKGAQVRIMGVLPSDPDTLEFDMTMNLDNLSVTPVDINGTLGYEDILNLPAVAVQYRPDTSPGLY